MKQVAIDGRTPARPSRRAGQGMVEYAIILTLVSVVVVVVLITQGTTLKHMFSNVSCGFSQCSAPVHSGDHGGDQGDGG
jgi:Flp pilus assembly pilin Flp